jgi:hypothetical protein
MVGSKPEATDLFNKLESLLEAWGVASGKAADHA